MTRWTAEPVCCTPFWEMEIVSPARHTNAFITFTTLRQANAKGSLSELDDIVVSSSATMVGKV